jgi:PAS domain S-box-containing protein
MDSHHQEISRCLFRESNDALFLFDPKDHRVLDVNPAALRLTGLEKEAACALQIGNLFRGAEPGGLDRLIDAYRRTGFYHSREGYWLARAAGEPIPVNLSVSRIHTRPEPMGLVVARDITERVRAQEALHESEARYRGLVETAPLIIWTVAADGRIRSLNPAFEAITGWPRDTWIGRPFAELIHPEDLPLANESFARTLAGASLPPYELRIRSSNGGELAIEVLSAACQPGGDRPDVSGIARDITERRRAAEASRRAEAMRHAKEAAEAADRAKGEFLGHISHEIRTPMTAILGFTDLLLGDDRVRALPADLLDGLRTIKQSGGHLLNLIEDLLDLTKIEAGRLRIDSRPCSPARIAGDVAAALRPRALARGLTLDLEIAPSVPSTVLTDAVRLRQILINLLSNAIKFTRAGGVRLVIDLESGLDEGSTLRVDVIDTGVGMSEAEVVRLFEPFFSADARNARESGAGLGLAISRRLTELLGGRIDVQSQPGQGSTFTLRLPVGAPDPAGPATPDPTAGDRALPSSPAPPLLGSRVLLAEDNEAIRRFVALRLQQAGASVEVAGDGQEAIEQALAALAAGRSFDWILMDVQMPVLDGYEATRELRGRGYRGPIIALTAFATPENREESLRFGCDDHISKPVDWGHLMDVLNAHREQIGDRVAP